MNIWLDGLNLVYDELGEGREIIFLHGWQMNKETFNEIVSHLDGYKKYVIDLPGFGKTEEPKKGFNLNYYVNILERFILEKEIHDPVIIAHSFGGRIAIKYASSHNVSKLVLVDSAGIKKRDLTYYMKVYSYKILKRFGIKLNTGSKDYQNASPVMKEVLKNVTNEDLSDELKMIKAKTLIIWGENDSVTPLEDAFKMEKLIIDSGLVIIPKVGHFPYIENANYFNLVLDSFLSSDEI